MNIKFVAIAAMGKNREIGLNGKIPWNYPDEYQHYKDTVKGHYVLVGRKNFEMNGSDIEGAMPLILSRSNFSHANALTFNSPEEVIDYANEMEIEKIFVIGGGEIYKLMLPYISEFYCSIVDYEGPADTFFPEYMFYEWEVLNQEVHEHWTLYHMRKHPDYVTSSSRVN
jgi:dihydrofolate reductase